MKKLLTIGLYYYSYYLTFILDLLVEKLNAINFKFVLIRQILFLYHALLCTSQQNRQPLLLKLVL